MKTLFPPQAKSAKILIDALQHHDAAIDSSETGTGKTVKAVEIARESTNPPLVVCPKAVIPSWKACFAEQEVDYLDVINYESLRTGNSKWGSWRNVRGKQIFVYHQDVHFIIWDEVHRCKGRNTKNGRMLACADVGHNLMLSATAAEDPSEMKSIGYLLGLFELRLFMKWARANGCYIDPWSKLKFSSRKREEILPRLNKQIYPSRGHKVTREELGEWFQETKITTEPLDFGDNGKIVEIVETMQEELEHLRERSASDPEAGEHAQLVAMLRARQKVELLKLPVLIDLATEYLVEGLSVVIFLNFNDSIRAVQKLLKMNPPPPVIWGEQNAQERELAREEFQSNDCKIILVNAAAGGVGLDLHDIHGGHPRVSLISPSWNAKDLVQVLGRVDRAGAKSPTIQRILFAENTIEEEVRNSLDVKLKNMQLLHTI